MQGETTTSVKRRILRNPARSVVEPMTPSRALRQALSRAAERSMSLSLGVLGIRQDVLPLDQMLAQLEDDLMLTTLTNVDGPSGFVGLDLQTRAAVIEVQTLGRVGTAAATARQITAADRAMAEPLMSMLLAELATETRGTALDGWVTGHWPQGHFLTARDAGLGLPDGDFRVVRLTLDLGAGGRQGLLLLALPMPAPVVTARPAAPEPDWSGALAGNVLGANADVRAVLHRMRLPLRAIEAFSLGQILALPGVGVGSVRVETADARLIGHARLGQMSGMRAIRIGAPGRQDMQDALPLPSGLG